MLKYQVGDLVYWSQNGWLYFVTLAIDDETEPKYDIGVPADAPRTISRGFDKRPESELSDGYKFKTNQIVEYKPTKQAYTVLGRSMDWQYPDSKSQTGWTETPLYDLGTAGVVQRPNVPEDNIQPTFPVV